MLKYYSATDNFSLTLQQLHNSARLTVRNSSFSEELFMWIRSNPCSKDFRVVI